MFDPINNALRINATASPGGTHSPKDADQVFTSIFDSINNAVRVNCVLGCGANVTWAGDLGGSPSSQTVVGIQQHPISAANPASNQVLTWTGSAWTPVTPASGAGTGACGSNQFVTGVNLGSSPNCLQPAFSTLSGTAPDAQLASSYSGVGACPANQFAKTLARNVGPACAAAVTASAAPSNQFATGVSAAGALTYAQPGFSNLTGTLSDAQLANPYSGVGTCPANQFANTLTRNAGPACAQPAFSTLAGTASPGQLPAATTSNQGALILAKDLGGTGSLPQVVGLQGNTVAAGTPAGNQFLGWSTAASQWQPLQPAFSNLTGSANCNQLPSLAGDATTSGCNVTVARLQGQNVASTLPTPGQVLTFSGGAWTPLAPSPGNVNCPNLPALTGDATTTAGSCSVTVAKLQGQPVASSTPNNGQVLTYSGGSWTPLAASVGNVNCPNLPALTGDATTSAGSCATNVASTHISGAASNAFPIFSSAGNLVNGPLSISSGVVMGTDPMQITPAVDAVGLMVTAKASGQTSDLFDVCDVAACTNKYFAVNSAGISSLFNHWIFGNLGQPQPGIATFLSGNNSPISAGYIEFATNTGGNSTKLTFDPTVSGGGVACVTTAVPSGACAAGTQIALLSGDLGNTAVAPQVVSTHLAAPLPPSQGGTGVATAAKNTVLAGPVSGGNAAPAFRALGAADVPGTGYWVNGAASGASTITLCAVDTECYWSLFIPTPLTNIGHLVFNVGTADSSSDVYSFGIYSSSGALLASTTPVSYTATGVQTVALSLAQNYAPGLFYLGITGHGGVTLKPTAAAASLLNASALSAGATTGGNVVASFAPASTWALGAAPLIALAP